MRAERYAEHERGEIRKRAERDLFALGRDQIFPTARKDDGTGIKENRGHEKADGKLEIRRRNNGRVAPKTMRGLCEPVVQSGKGLIDKHVAGSKQGHEETEAAKKYFAGEDAGEEKNLGLGKPDDRSVHAGIFEGNGGDQQDDADGGKNDEGDAAFARGGKLAERKFGRAKDKQSVESEFRTHGLVFEEEEEKRGVEDCRDGGDVLLRNGLDAAGDVRPAVDGPIESEQHGARNKFG